MRSTESAGEQGDASVCPSGPSASELKTPKELLRERAAVFDKRLDLLRFQARVLRHLAFSVGNDAGQFVIRHGYYGGVPEVAHFHGLARGCLPLTVRTMTGGTLLLVEARGRFIRHRARRKQNETNQGRAENDRHIPLAIHEFFSLSLA